MKILALDIETSPNLAYVWKLYGEQNIALNQLQASTEMLSFAAKWIGSPKVYFHSVHHDGKQAMVEAAHALLDEADAAMTWNGKTFDIPHLNREFLEAGLRPPAPYTQIDLMKAVKAQFRFPSYKLDYVSKALGLKGKVSHSGFSLWVACMNGDEAAWRKFKQYNKQDVVLLEELYEKLRAWVPGHPSVAAHLGQDVCPTCGSNDLQRRGYAVTLTGRYARFQCQKCGRWTRAVRREDGVRVREAAS